MASKDDVSRRLLLLVPRPVFDLAPISPMFHRTSLPATRSRSPHRRRDRELLKYLLPLTGDECVTRKEEGDRISSFDTRPPWSHVGTHPIR